MAKQTKKKALAYLRVSGKGQINKGWFPKTKRIYPQICKS
jgi:hypothetical protein